MRGAIFGSGVVHLLVLVALFVVRTPAALVIPGPETVQVALLDPSALMPTAPPKVEEPPPPEPKLSEVKPVEDTGVKLQPEVRKKKPVVKPRDEVAPTPESPTLPSAPVGSAGLRGDVSVDSRDFEFTYYLVLVRNRIAANWSPPAGLATGGRRVRAVIAFKIDRGGSLAGVRMEEGSGMEFFDRSAVRAVVLSDPMPPLPLGFGASELGVHFGFDWEAP
jgi:TonB family protein